MINPNPAPTALLPSIPQSSSATPVQEYLSHRFPEQEALLRDHVRKTSPSAYGAAYKHCLLERTIHLICDVLGMTWPISHGGFKPIIVDELSIELTDIVNWTQCAAPDSFCNIRKNVAKSRIVLECLNRRQDSGSLSLEQETARDMLSVMLGGKRVPLPSTEGNDGMLPGQMDAITCTKEKWVAVIKSMMDI